MTRQIRIALIIPALLLALTIIGPRAWLEAQERRSPAYESPKLYKGEKISLDYKNEEIHQIIKIIGEAAGKDIVVPDTVSGRVTLKLRDVPWDQALDIVLAARNLDFEESDGVLAVYERPRLGDGRSGGRRLSPKASQPAQTNLLDKKVFTPKYAPIGQVAAELNKLKSERGKIVSIGNDIYVEDKPEAIAAMSKTFIYIDRVAPQILIEARIIEADPAFMETLGANWQSSDAASGRPLKEAGEKVSPTALAYDFLSQDKSLLLEAAISSFQTTGGARTLAAPRIIAVNDMEVSIKQGHQIGCGSGRRSANTEAHVQFKEFLMELLVTPHIEEDSQTLTLDLKLINDTPDFAEPDHLKTREAGAKLRIKDGQTVVIGGLITEAIQGDEGRPADGRSGSISDWLPQEHPRKSRETLFFITATIIPVKI